MKIRDGLLPTNIAKFQVSLEEMFFGKLSQNSPIGSYRGFAIAIESEAGDSLT